MSQDLEATAWHEAGHAVAYVLHRLPFRYVTIRPRQGYAGQVALYRPRGANPVTLSVLAAAGPLGERWGYEDAHGEDEETAAWLVGFMGGSRHDEVDIARFWRGSRAELDALTNVVMGPHRAAIGRVAEALLSSPRALPGRHVLSLVEEGRAA